MPPGGVIRPPPKAGFGREVGIVLAQGIGMKRAGIILLVLGLVGFVLASSQRAGYDTVEGGIKQVFSSEERSKKEGWETARWVSVGLAALGLVLTVVPAKKA
jgi:hypothetical protein